MVMRANTIAFIRTLDTKLSSFDVSKNINHWLDLALPGRETRYSLQAGFAMGAETQYMVKIVIEIKQGEGADDFTNMIDMLVTLANVEPSPSCSIADFLPPVATPAHGDMVTEIAGRHLSPSGQETFMALTGEKTRSYNYWCGGMTFEGALAVRVLPNGTHKVIDVEYALHVIKPSAWDTLVIRMEEDAS